MGCSGSKTPPTPTTQVATDDSVVDTSPPCSPGGTKKKRPPPGNGFFWPDAEQTAAANPEETQPPDQQKHFKVDLERLLTDGEDEALGATFIHHDEGKTLLVASIMQEGLFPRWNQANEYTPEKQINMGDVILMINGMIGNCDLMVPETAKKSMVLIVQRADKSVRGSLRLAPTQPSAEQIALLMAAPAVKPPSTEKTKWSEVEEAAMSDKSTDVGDASPSASKKAPPLPPPSMPPPPEADEPEPRANTKESLVMQMGGDVGRQLQLEGDECNDGDKAVYCKGYMCMF